MKEKLIVGIICVIVLIGAIFTAITIRNNKKNEENFQENLVIAENPLTDECTEEYQIALQSLEIAEVNSSDDKISSNSLLTLKKYYKECGHTINEYVEMLPELVNMTQDEAGEKFQDWELIGFNSREVTFIKEFDGTCGEHFSLKEEKGKVVIYKILVDGTKQLYDKTEISTEFLPDTDLLQMQSEQGIQIYGKEELNKVLEDFE
jgi:hypothetical protein